MSEEIGVSINKYAITVEQLKFFIFCCFIMNLFYLLMNVFIIDKQSEIKFKRNYFVSILLFPFSLVGEGLHFYSFIVRESFLALFFKSIYYKSILHLYQENPKKALNRLLRNPFYQFLLDPRINTEIQIARNQLENNNN